MRASLLVLVLMTSTAAATEIDVAEALGRAHAGRQAFLDGLHLGANDLHGGFPSVGPSQGLVGALDAFTPEAAYHSDAIDFIVGNGSAIVLDAKSGRVRSARFKLTDGTWYARPGRVEFQPADPTKPSHTSEVLHAGVLAPVGRRAQAGLAWRYGRAFARDLGAAQAAGEAVVVRKTTWRRRASTTQESYQLKVGDGAWRTVGGRQARDVLALRAKGR